MAVKRLSLFFKKIEKSYKKVLTIYNVHDIM
nr:MAG TPA: hypothetical protein [Caudoviricetes sp.]